MKVRIVSPESDGGIVSAMGTQVYLVADDGTETKIDHINSLVVRYPMDGAVEANIGLIVNPDSIVANPILTFDALQEAAAYYGYELHQVG